MAAPPPGGADGFVPSFDEALEESTKAQRAFASRVTIYHGDGTGGSTSTKGMLPLPSKYAKASDDSNKETYRAPPADGAGPPSLIPDQPNYETLFSDDWTPGIGAIPDASADAPLYSPARQLYHADAGPSSMGGEFLNPLAAGIAGRPPPHAFDKPTPSGAAKAPATAPAASAAAAAAAPSGGANRWNSARNYVRTAARWQQAALPMMNVAVLTDQRMLRIKELCLVLFRILDTNERGVISAAEVKVLLCAAWEVRVEDGVSLSSAYASGAYGVDNERDALITCLQSALEEYGGRMTIGQLMSYIADRGVPAPYTVLELEGALSKAAAILTAAPESETRVEILLAPFCMVVLAVANTLTTLFVFVGAVPRDSAYFEDGACSDAGGRWVDFSELTLPLSTNRIGALAYALPASVAAIQLALAVAMAVAPLCRRKAMPEHAKLAGMVRRSLAHMVVLEDEASGVPTEGPRGVGRTIAFHALLAASVLPPTFLALALGGFGDAKDSFSNDYHTIYLLSLAHCFACGTLLLRAVNSMRPPSAQATQALARDRSLLTNHPIDLLYSPHVRTSLAVWEQLVEGVGRPDAFMPDKVGDLLAAPESRVVGVLLCAGFALSPLAALAIQPGSCWGEGPLDHGVMTVAFIVVFQSAGTVLVGDLFDLAAVHRARSTAVKRLGMMLSMKGANEGGVPYLSALSSPKNLTAFIALREYLTRFYLSGDAASVGRGDRIGWSVSMTLFLHVMMLVFALLAAQFRWRIAFYHIFCFCLATTYYILGLENRGSLSAALSFQRSLSRHAKLLTSEAARIQVAAPAPSGGGEAGAASARHLEHAVRSLELTAKSFVTVAEQRPRIIGVPVTETFVLFFRLATLVVLCVSLVLACTQ